MSRKGSGVSREDNGKISAYTKGKQDWGRNYGPLEVPPTLETCLLCDIREEVKVLKQMNITIYSP